MTNCRRTKDAKMCHENTPALRNFWVKLGDLGRFGTRIMVWHVAADIYSKMADGLILSYSTMFKAVSDAPAGILKVKGDLYLQLLQEKQ